MPEEPEVPLEEVQEHLHHALHKAGHHSRQEGHKDEGQEGWTRFIGIATALLAVVAAIGSLQSGFLVNEALIEKNNQVSRLTQASDQWNYYQAEGLKALIYRTTAQTLPAGSPALQDDLRQARHYQDKQDDLQKSATDLESQSERSNHAAERYLDRHHVFAFSVSLCQIAIALSAVAALTKRRRIWLFGLAAGGIATILLVYGFLPYPWIVRLHHVLPFL